MTNDQIPEIQTTLQDQTALAITIYNRDLALVRDSRKVFLPSGESSLAVQEVSARIRPETALLRNVNSQEGFWVLEQNFDFDLLTPEKLLEKFVGHTLVVLTQIPKENGEGFQERREEAEVLAVQNGPVLKFKDRIETGWPGRFLYPDVPADLRARPTLVLRIESTQEGSHELELCYLSSGLHWRADYVANLAPNEDSMELSAWVTLTNESGATYPEATLQLVAGDVHRVQEGPLFSSAVPELRFNAPGGPPQMKEENLFEYHLYTLNRTTTLKDKQTKQVALLTAMGVPVHKEFLLRGESHYYQNPFGELGDKLKVGVYLEFKNLSEHGLGMPLPKGTVRVYKQDAMGRAQFVGEDAIDHTPKKETLRLKLGEAFDITARRKQVDHINHGRQGRFACVFESAFELELRNAKPEAIVVNCLEPIPGDWEILESTHAFEKPTARLAKFSVTVPGEGSSLLKYRVRTRW